MRVQPQTLRVLRVLAGVNVVLAFAICVAHVSTSGTPKEVAAAGCFGLGFAAIFVSATRELRQTGTGRAWMTVGGLLLVAASLIHLLA